MPVVAVSRVVNAPAPKVWSTIADVENAGRWNPQWRNIEITSEQRHGRGMTFRAGLESGEAFDFEVADWSHEEMIAFAPIRDEAENYGISLERHAFRIQALEGGRTRVELSAVASTRGFKGRLAGLFFWKGYQKHGLNEALDMLAALVEPDSWPEPEPASTDQ